MASAQSDPFPQTLRMRVDDVGEFLLLVGERLPVGALVTDGKGPGRAAASGLVLQLTQGVHDGARWSVVGGAEPLELVAGETVELAGESYRVRVPDEASPLLWLQPITDVGSSERPGLLLMAVGETLGFSIGTAGCAWQVPGVERAIHLSANPEGLRVACEGGVRYSAGDGEFDGALPYQEASWSSTDQQMFWSQARGGSGPPFFITLEPVAG